MTSNRPAMIAGLYFFFDLYQVSVQQDAAVCFPMIMVERYDEVLKFLLRTGSIGLSPQKKMRA